MTKSERFPRRLFDGGVGFGVAVGVWLVLAVMAAGWPWWGVAAVAVAPALCALLANMVWHERALRLDPEGLSEEHWFGPNRVHPWPSIQAIERRPSHAVIQFDDGALTIDTTTHNWRRLHRLIEAHLLGQGDQALVSDREMEDLLGCGEGGALLCSAPPRWLRLWAAWPAPLLTAGGLWWAAGLWLAGTWAWCTMDQRRCWVRADGQGLEVRRGRRRLRLAWADIDDMQILIAPVSRFYWSATDYAMDRLVRLHTDAGPVEWLLSDVRGRRLQEAVGRVLAERAAGRNLPQQSGIPDAAISLARLGPAQSDRALSLAEYR